MYKVELRGFGFAHSAYLIALLGVFFPALRPLTALIVVLLSVLGIWLGAAEAHKLRGWRTLLFPVVAVAVAVVGLALLQQLLAGAALTLQSIVQALGIQP